jgi:enoyl-CoA hydratase/carnithine racemase
MTSTFGLNETTDSLWRVTFLNPPINLIDATMIRELRELLTTLERSMPSSRTSSIASRAESLASTGKA